jgi:hypothetical protein
MHHVSWLMSLCRRCVTQQSLHLQQAPKPARQVASGARKTVRERAGWWKTDDGSKLNAWYGPDRKKVFGESCPGARTATSPLRHTAACALDFPSKSSTEQPGSVENGL